MHDGWIEGLGEWIMNDGWMDGRMNDGKEADDR